MKIEINNRFKYLNIQMVEDKLTLKQKNQMLKKDNDNLLAALKEYRQLINEAEKSMFDLQNTNDLKWWFKCNKKCQVDMEIIQENENQYIKKQNNQKWIRVFGDKYFEQGLNYNWQLKIERYDDLDE